MSTSTRTRCERCHRPAAVQPTAADWDYWNRMREEAS